MSIGPALGLLPNGHQFESPQGHWRFTRSLTLGPHGISQGTRKLARTSTVIKNKKKLLVYYCIFSITHKASVQRREKCLSKIHVYLSIMWTFISEWVSIVSCLIGFMNIWCLVSDVKFLTREKWPSNLHVNLDTHMDVYSRVRSNSCKLWVALGTFDCLSFLAHEGTNEFTKWEIYYNLENTWNLIIPKPFYFNLTTKDATLELRLPFSIYK